VTALESARSFRARLHAVLLGALAAVAIALPALINRPVFGEPGPRARGGEDSLRLASSLTDPPQPGQLIQPEALARALADTTAKRPVVLQVGFKVLFRAGHIPGSRFIGPASKPEGLAALQQELRKIPREQAVVLYCGCCPWADCPNVRPAFRAARKIGFTDVRVLNIAKNLQHDWIDQGLPVVEGD
jgi:thiosulfate/3-mercaptopyruvate sulfurtransferase